MTLLGAVLDDDSVIVGADSVLTRVDAMGMASYEGTTIKFRQLRDMNALYGYYGSQDVGEPIGVQIEKSTRWGTWAELLPVATDMLRTTTTAQGFPRHQLTSLMFAGYIGEELAIHRIGDYGHAEAQETPAFLGNGRTAAQVGWRIAAESSPDSSLEDRLRLVMRQTAVEVVPLGPPMRYWRATSQGIEILEDDTWEPRNPWHTPG